MSFTHSIMFHHFHSEKHLPAQGSLSSDDFSEMLDWLGERYNLIGANEYLHKFNNSALEPQDICLSFDDALLCQYDIALPILKERRLDAFFFVCSSVLNKQDNLEILRYFRTNLFSSIDDFYEQFFNLVDEYYEDELVTHKEHYPALHYLDAFLFYSKDDKWFRYLRDQVLGPERYEEMMISLMEKKNFNSDEIINELCLSEDNLKEVAKHGNLVGLHSFDHPTQISKLSYEEQLHQYTDNYNHLKRLVGEVVSMSHPCGDYNDDTLKILSDLGIQIGFRSSLSTTEVKSRFEIPRDDHANIFARMKR